MPTAASAISSRRGTKPVKATPLSVRPGFGPAVHTVGPLELEAVKVNAQLAELWMERNVSNRSLRKQRLAEFKRDMLSNNWRDVGDPIRFDTNGNMCDGQHRMLALMNAALVQPDIELEFVVVRGVAPEDRFVIDTGTRRSAGDQLKMGGYKNHSMLASAAKWCALYDRRALYSDAASKSITHGDIMDYVADNPELTTVVNRVAASMRRLIDMPPGAIAAGYFLTHRLNAKEADEFFERLCDMVDVPRGDPIHALHRRLRDLDRARANHTGDVWLSLLFRAWNARRAGQTLRALPVYKDNIPIQCPDLK